MAAPMPMPDMNLNSTDMDTLMSGARTATGAMSFGGLDFKPSSRNDKTGVVVAGLIAVGVVVYLLRSKK